MSVWSTLDSAFGVAVSDLGADASGVVSSVLAGLTVQVKTNLGPAFTLGGISQPPGNNTGLGSTPSTPGLLDNLGIKFSATISDAAGNTIATVGSPPDTDPVLVTAYLALLGSIAYLSYRGLRAIL
jgi:hypothetical protein